MNAGTILLLTIAVGFFLPVMSEAKDVYRLKVQTVVRPSNCIVNLAMVDWCPVREGRARRSRRENRTRIPRLAEGETGAGHFRTRSIPA